MNIDNFFAHYDLECNPFDAEEARLDPIFDRMKQSRLTHPDFSKILGRPEQAGTAIVFGEKGSGKTAIRLLMGRRLREHNVEHPDRRVLVVDYDDLNPVLDKVMRARRQHADKVLSSFRLEDHQDAILSRAVTKLTGALLGETAPTAEPTPLPDKFVARPHKALSKDERVDLAVLAALYDQPRAGSDVDRWRRLRSKLRLGCWRASLPKIRLGAIVVTLAAVGLLIAWLILRGPDEPFWLMPLLIAVAAGGVVLWAWWLWRWVSLWWLCRKIAREMPAVERTPGQLRAMLGELGPAELSRQPFPIPTRDADTAGDARYQLTRRLVDLLGPFGYVALFVLVDRLDEPTLVSGHADKMKSLVWPMFDNKFLQQEGVGLKLLLPIELRHLLHRESPEFYQEARMDKQNLIDRLTWSGAILYDLCSTRLRACRGTSAELQVSSSKSEDTEPADNSKLENRTSQLSLTDLFEPDVTREMLVDALDQMHQPRDAFKFLYQVIQEHCRLIPEDQADYKIARLTLESVRRQQSQRVQELYRGLTPA